MRNDKKMFEVCNSIIPSRIYEYIDTNIKPFFIKSIVDPKKNCSYNLFLTDNNEFILKELSSDDTFENEHYLELCSFNGDISNNYCSIFNDYEEIENSLNGNEFWELLYELQKTEQYEFLCNDVDFTFDLEYFYEKFPTVVEIEIETLFPTKYEKLKKEYIEEQWDRHFSFSLADTSWSNIRSYVCEYAANQ